MKTQFELEITEDKLRRAEDELHQVEERIEFTPERHPGRNGQARSEGSAP